MGVRADLYVLFKIDKSRGSKVLIDVLGEEFDGVLGEEFDGVLGCDYFSAYHKYMKDFDITVQFCIAHLIRDIKCLAGLRDTEMKACGKRLLAAVKAMFKIIHNRDNMTPDAFMQAMENARETIMEVALANVPSRLDKNGKEQKREAFNRARLTAPGISANFTDSDGDSMDNYSEWLTGTDPTNALSFFGFQTAGSGKVPTGFQLQWNSATNRTYRIESSTNLMDGAFQTLESGIQGLEEATEFIDTNANGKTQSFYRVFVE